MVSTDYLVDAIWDENPPETARTQVQICVSRLRKSLAPTGVDLRTQPPGYLIQAGPGNVDMHRCDQLVGESDAALREGRSAESAALLRKAVDLWRGPALSGISSRMLRTKAARLDENRTNLIETYLGLDLELGKHRQLIGEITALVEEFPLRERLRGQLMLALHGAGRQAEALETYRRGRELLIDELGLEPGRELRDLESAILAGDVPAPATAASSPTPPTSAISPTSSTHPSSPTPPGSAPVPVPDTANRAGHHPPETAEPAPEPPAATGGRTPAAPAQDVLFRQLPADTADFVGREDWISGVEDTVTRPGTRGRAVGVAVVIGRPGVGKSALATHVAHRVAEEHFPDGQLYCDLRGSRNDPVESDEVLARFLRALGIPGQSIPESRAERAEMYRSLLSERRVLVLLDDAASERQVIDLLPGASNCALIVTSRSRLTGVPGANLMELDVFSEEQALALLRRVVGDQRLDAEPAAASALVRSVGRLPLALRIVAARLVARRHWSLASMVNRLSDERHRLDELAHGELTMRASLSLTYDGMDADTRRVLRLFALADGPSQPGWVAGALLEDQRAYPSDLLEPLVDAQMLDVSGLGANGDPRYRFHDIIRLFARERLMEESEEGVRTEAVARLVGGWLALVDEANIRIHGGDYLLHHGEGARWSSPQRLVAETLKDPMAWLEEEQANLCATVDLAADAGLHELCWDLAYSLGPMFSRRGHLDEWEKTNRRAMAAVKAADSPRGAAVLTFSYASLHLARRRYGEARRLLEEALRASEELGDELGRAKCNRELAHLDQMDGAYDRALLLCDEAYRGFEGLGDALGMGRALTLSGHVHTVTGDPSRGRADLERALSLYRETGDSRSRAQVLRRIGQAALSRGEEHEALRILAEALELLKGLSDPIGEGYLLHDLGRAAARSGSVEEARRFLGRSLAVREQIRDRRGEAQVAVDLADLLEGIGERDQAVELRVRSERLGAERAALA